MKAPYSGGVAKPVLLMVNRVIAQHSFLLLTQKTGRKVRPVGVPEGLI